MLLAETVDDLFGKVNPPPGLGRFGGDAYGGLLTFMNFGLNLILVIAGLFTLFNIILAGFSYMTSNGDPKKVSEAHNKIMFTVIGLGIIVAAPVIAGVIGMIVFGDWKAILSPSLTDISGNKL